MESEMVIPCFGQGLLASPMVTIFHPTGQVLSIDTANILFTCRNIYPRNARTVNCSGQQGNCKVTPTV